MPIALHLLEPFSCMTLSAIKNVIILGFDGIPHLYVSIYHLIISNNHQKTLIKLHSYKPFLCFSPKSLLPRIYFRMTDLKNLTIPSCGYPSEVPPAYTSNIESFPI